MYMYMYIWQSLHSIRYSLSYSVPKVFWQTDHERHFRRFFAIWISRSWAFLNTCSFNQFWLGEDFGLVVLGADCMHTKQKGTFFCKKDSFCICKLWLVNECFYTCTLTIKCFRDPFRMFYIWQYHMHLITS